MGHNGSYSWEFKLQMVQLLEKGEHNPSQISRDHHSYQIRLDSV